jgi:hypothetical protein
MAAAPRIARCTAAAPALLCLAFAALAAAQMDHGGHMAGMGAAAAMGPRPACVVSGRTQQTSPCRLEILVNS